ncbi:MAG: permease prefix domain 1-containing protein [Lachnospiraceae bacterium]|nr:permease prefix domain 1-containing protein [Lachnospiraceae bacterium]
METIKNYLEAMFAGMPDTPEVRRAKAELLQMMEDKYNELINEGQSENTAVGTVISEFGNLEDLAEDLGLTKEVQELQETEAAHPRRQISRDESEAFITNRIKKALFLALGIMMCITSVSCPILFAEAGDTAVLAGPALMFVFIGLGVGFIVYSSFVDGEWKFIRKQLCFIDMNTASYVKDRRRNFESVRAICVTLGVILCVVCWVPCMLFATTSRVTIGPAIMFLLVGIGVFLIVYANNTTKGFDLLLRLNAVKTISGNYGEPPAPAPKYRSKAAETIVLVYWPAVTSIYLIVSFLTFQWGITWIIWPIAAVAHRAVVINCQAYDD